MEKGIWNISPENKAKIDKDIANYVIEQAEKSLRYSIEVADKTTSKAITLLLVLLPVASTIVGFLVNSVKQYKALMAPETLLLMYFLFLCIVALIFAVKLVLPRNTMGLGREPKQLVVDQVLQLADCSSEQKLLIYKLNEIKNYQFKIEYNKQQNNARIVRFKNILIYTGFTAIFGLFCYILIVYLLAAQKL